MDPGHLLLYRQAQLVREIFSSNTTLMAVLARATSHNLPNWYLTGGALSQTIWKSIADLPQETGIPDYDLVYRDASDLSHEAGNLIIQAGKRIFADIGVGVEIPNQARVQLWYEKKHGISCPPHTSVEAGIDTWRRV